MAFCAVHSLGERHLVRNAPVDVLVESTGLSVEQRRRGAWPRHHRLPHLADDVVVDQIDDLGPELGLGDVRVDIDEEIVLQALGLDSGVQEDIARVGLDGDLGELSNILGGSLLHQMSSSLCAAPIILLLPMLRPARRDGRPPGDLPRDRAPVPVARSAP
jgi:hypothetical protein